ncbi:hypothetical protein J7E88_05975 [Streptomyces sp. ISL-10]|uniref:hypothetical protein n=1 Tax=Streptomyces sp. ISL-10 TaxID=2819172 RepID=UPI001BEBD957|nr:hypothetical protein [Streptomyces sp. ISL-10]MBT2364880.1 hypothetical protein [Streptomyces sp. ISL-10]
MSSDQQYPYGSYGTYEPYGQQPQQQPQQQQQPEPYQGHQDAYAQQPYQDAGATQTWQGDTWDTQYQPVVQPHAAADAAGPPPQHATAAALPPENGPHGAPTASTSAPPAPDAEAAPENGAQTRLTAAQRARAEGRSPIIAPGVQPAGLTAVLGLLVAGGAALGTYALLVPLVLLQAVTAAGWFRLNGMWPARQGIALAFAGGLAADAALLAVGRDNAPAAIIGTLGVWVLLTLVLQLRSHASADERMSGLMATVASAALAILATGFLAASPDAVTVGAIAVAVAAVARALPLPGVVSVVVSLSAAAGAGIAVGGPTGVGSAGALLGFASGACALIGLRVASYDYPSRFVHMTAGVALPLTAAAPAVYLLGRALV